MEKVGASTLILATSTAAVEQWRREIKERTDIPDDSVGTYTGGKKDIRPITIATYSVVSLRRGGVVPAPLALPRAQLRPGRLRRGPPPSGAGLPHDGVAPGRAPPRADRDARARGRQGGRRLRPDRPQALRRAVEGAREARVHRGRRVLRGARPARRRSRGRATRTPTSTQRFRIAASNPAKDAVVAELLARHARPARRSSSASTSTSSSASPRRSAVRSSRARRRRRSARCSTPRFARATLKRLVLSRVGSLALDLPSASLAIEVSGTFGSRQEEAQRVGRILRPKDDVGALLHRRLDRHHRAGRGAAAPALPRRAGISLHGGGSRGAGRPVSDPKAKPADIAATVRARAVEYASRMRPAQRDRVATWAGAPVPGPKDDPADVCVGRRRPARARGRSSRHSSATRATRCCTPSAARDVVDDRAFESADPRLLRLAQGAARGRGDALLTAGLLARGHDVRPCVDAFPAVRLGLGPDLLVWLAGATDDATPVMPFVRRLALLVAYAHAEPIALTAQGSDDRALDGAPSGRLRRDRLPDALSRWLRGALGRTGAMGPDPSDADGKAWRVEPRADATLAVGLGGSRGDARRHDADRGVGHDVRNARAPRTRPRRGRGESHDLPLVGTRQGVARGASRPIRSLLREPVPPAGHRVGRPYAPGDGPRVGREGGGRAARSTDGAAAGGAPPVPLHGPADASRSGSRRTPIPSARPTSAASPTSRAPIAWRASR